MELLFVLALLALTVLAAQRITAKADRTRKTLKKKATVATRRARASLGTQTVATTRRKSRKGGRR